MTGNSLPLGELGAAQFLTEYWQKRPLLVRAAYPGLRSPITPEELAGLACEQDVESRLVMERGGSQPWALRHGPFAEADFLALPDSHWTLLVQEANRHVPELAFLLDDFRFIPNWRIDDVMVSYAPPQGSVGPHVDSYDVFLLQARGRRRWQISAEADQELIEGLDLRILKHFTAQQEWVLEPGDMLYLPPGIAHYGVALEDCMTFSVGFRAPSHAELLTAFLDHVLTQVDPEVRYGDPDLSLQPNPGLIDDAALERVRQVMSRLSLDRDTMARWLASFVTAPRLGQGPEARYPTLSAARFTELVGSHAELWRSEYSRFAYLDRGAEGAELYVDGLGHPLPPVLAWAAPMITGQRRFTAEELAPALQDRSFAALLTDLYNGGHFYFPDDDE